MMRESSLISDSWQKYLNWRMEGNLCFISLSTFSRVWVPGASLQSFSPKRTLITTLINDYIHTSGGEFKKDYQRLPIKSGKVVLYGILFLSCQYLLLINKAMQERENLRSEKRNQWRKEIRKKEINELFTKKRKELSYSLLTHDKKMTDDSQKMSEIRQMLSIISLQKCLEALRKLISLDTSLSLFFQVTGVVPQKVPQIFAQILRQSIVWPAQVPQTINFHKYWNYPEWLHQNWNAVQEIDALISEWQDKNRDVLSKLFSTIHSLSNFNQILQPKIIQFFTFLSNIRLINCWSEQTLNTAKQSTQSASQTNHLRNLTSCTDILTNVLAGPDEEILPYLDEILYATGGNIKFIGLFFNMFLVTGISEGFKMDMLKIIVRVLNFNTDVFLDEHKEIVQILRLGLSAFDRKTITQEEQFVGIGQKLIFLLGEILKVLNLRYDNTGLYLKVEKTHHELEDLQFVFNLSIIFSKLAQNTFLIRLILESNSIRTLMLNCLRLSQNPYKIKTIVNYLLILSESTQDHFSMYNFENEPRLLKRIISNILQISRLSLTQIQSGHYQIVGESFFLLSNCCGSKTCLQKMIENNLFDLIVSFYFRVQSVSRVPKNIRQECQYLFLNLVIGLKREIKQHHQAFLEVLSQVFSKEENTVIFRELLYYKNQSKLLHHALGFLNFLITASQKYNRIECIDHMLRRPDLVEQLHQIIEDHPTLSEQAERVLISLKNRNSIALGDEQSEMFL